MATEEPALHAQWVMHTISMTQSAISTHLCSCLLYSVFNQCFLFRTISLHAATARNVTTTYDERHTHATPNTCNIMLHNMCWLYNHLQWLFFILYSWLWRWWQQVSLKPQYPPTGLCSV
jgi:hypothetical protein